MHGKINKKIYTLTLIIFFTVFSIFCGIFFSSCQNKINNTENPSINYSNTNDINVTSNGIENTTQVTQNDTTYNLTTENTTENTTEVTTEPVKSEPETESVTTAPQISTAPPEISASLPKISSEVKTSQPRTATQSPKPVQSAPPKQVYNAQLSYDIKMPSTGSKVDTSTKEGTATIDYSNISKGYVMLKHSGGAKGKLLGYIIAPDGKLYQYPMESNNKFISCPLQSGNGTYTVHIMMEVDPAKKTYTPLIKQEYSVKLEDPYLPFIYSSCKVNFDGNSTAVKKAAELIRDAERDKLGRKSKQLEKIEIICEFVAATIKYDYAKTQPGALPAGYIPNPDNTLRDKKGVCSDYSVLFATMLRSQGIAVKYIEGDVRTSSKEMGRHAWNLVYTKETGVICVKINFNGTYTLIDTTFKAGGGSGADKDGYFYTQDKAY